MMVISTDRQKWSRFWPVVQSRVVPISAAKGSLWDVKGRDNMKRILIPCLMLIAGPAVAQQNVPQIPFTSVPDFLKLPPGMNFGEVPGVAVNSKGHIFVFTRSNSSNGPAYAPTAAQLLEFGPDGSLIGEIGKGLYGWS